MRSTYLLFILLAIFNLNWASEPEKRQVIFDGETYLLAHSDQNETQSIQEFVRKKDSLDRWERLLSIRKFMTITDSKILVQNFVQALQSENPKAPFDVQTNDKTGEILLDFVTWTADGSSAEFNIWKFKNTPNGVIGYQFAMKNTNAKAFLTKLPKIRGALLQKMAHAEFSRD